MTSAVTVRPLRASDKDKWAPLWRAYLAFYETSRPQVIFDLYFDRLIGTDPQDFNALVAEVDGDLIGLTHYLFHRHGWSRENTCYLQDLYADPSVRGTGVGRALIEAVYAAADAAGVPSVYWLTQDFNTDARKLYDRIGVQTPFIKYTRMMQRLVLALTLLLNACVPVTQDPGTPTRNSPLETTLPEMRTFAVRQPRATTRSNGDITQDFLDLSFRMESGRELPILTRFEGPVTLRVAGAAPATLTFDLNRLLARLRDEAGIDISRTSARTANITVHAVPRREILSVLPQTACFVAPNVDGLRDYRTARRQPRTNWTLLEQRERLAIFVPSDASPQEIRDCLHEELAQSLGPLNDLYHLPNTVFNDDNVHSVLTGFDMLILRATYSPELRSGMSRAEVAARLPGILARINPNGERGGRSGISETPQAWGRAIVRALGPGTTASVRRGAADQAVRIATNEGWQDHRRGFAHFARGRLLTRADPEASHREFLAAYGYYARAPEAKLYRADVAQHLASYAISQGNGTEALRIIDPHLDTALKAEHAMLLATLLMLRAEALDLLGRSDQARAVRLDSLGWARYGFGPDWAVRAKLRDVAKLNPQNTPA